MTSVLMVVKMLALMGKDTHGSRRDASESGPLLLGGLPGSEQKRASSDSLVRCTQVRVRVVNSEGHHAPRLS